MRSWLCTAVLAAALASAAPAQSAFDQRIAHWRVSGAAASCIAFNRPAYELNGSPFNALSVSLNKQERWNFMGFFFTSFVRPKVKTSGMSASGVKVFGQKKTMKFQRCCLFNETESALNGEPFSS
jgi:hypothetical protein